MTFTPGRFVLLYGTPEEHNVYVTSWDTWAECDVAFPLEPGHYLHDEETGRTWFPGSAYDWEEAKT